MKFIQFKYPHMAHKCPMPLNAVTEATSAKAIK